jgi:hypothetical protein
MWGVICVRIVHTVRTSEVVSLDQASHDLSLVRRGEAETLEAIEAQQLPF